jgi:[ribosomal protein S5]-alanine N-acetyltransferase
MAPVLPTTMPRLVHGDVVLRAFEARDLPLVQSVASDPLIPLISTVPTSGTVEDALAYIGRQHERLSTGAGYSFAVVDATSDHAVGQIGLWVGDIREGRASVGYWVASERRRRGFAATALQALTAWAFTLPEVQRLQLYVEPWNDASWRTAERCGYRREGLLASWQNVGPERKDMFMYSRVRAQPVAQSSDARLAQHRPVCR